LYDIDSTCASLKEVVGWKAGNFNNVSYLSLLLGNTPVKFGDERRKGVQLGIGGME